MANGDGQPKINGSDLIRWLKDTKTIIAFSASVLGISGGITINQVLNSGNLKGDLSITHAELAEQLQYQSYVDSIAAHERWITRIGIQYLICGDSIPLEARPTFTCKQMLRFAPELISGVIQPPNIPPVWRPKR